MQLNGQEYVAVDPSVTARGGALHPSLPSRPKFDIVPKEELGKKLTPAQKKERDAENMKRGVANMDAESSVDVVRNRRAIRLANMSAADRLRAEMNGETVDGDDEGEETVTLERKDEEEKEEMEAGQARQVLEGQAEDEGVDEEVVQPALGTDEEEGEAAVPLEGEETMDEGEEADGQDGSAERGVKRKADDVEDEEAEDGDDGLDAPPDIESDQPASKKKLKFNADGTVDGYEDDVRYDFLGVLPKSVN
jgi:5'-3' exoribonuclease 2